MSFSAEQIETSYLQCREVCRRAHSNLTRGFSLISRDKRRAMEALYAFMRETDDLVDFDIGAENSSNQLAGGLAGKKRRIDRWREALRLAVEEEKIVESETGSSESAASIMPAVADAIRRFTVPVSHFFAAIDGVEMDLEKTRYETFAELEAYCERVASAVGLACIHIWGFDVADDAQRAKIFESARAAGVAFQLTNVLRDVVEDFAVGRIYIPQEDLARFACGEECLSGGNVGPEFLRLMNFEIARAEDYYRRGVELVKYLHADGRRLYCVMFGSYLTLLKKIAAEPTEVLRGRVRLTSLERVRCLVRGLCGVGFANRLKGNA